MQLLKYIAKSPRRLLSYSRTRHISGFQYRSKDYEHGFILNSYLGNNPDDIFECIRWVYELSYHTTCSVPELHIYHHKFFDVYRRDLLK